MSSSYEFWVAHQKFRQDMRKQMLHDFEENCDYFPVEMMSSEDIRGSSLYATTKKDFFFPMEKLVKFDEIYHTLQYFPVNQKHLRFWRRLVYEVFRHINFNFVPQDYNAFAIEFLSLERVIRGIQIFNLYGTLPGVTTEEVVKRLGLSLEHFLILVPRTKFNSDSVFKVTKNYGFSKESGEYLQQHPISYSKDDFDLGEGGLFKPEMVYMLKTIARRREPKIISQIRDDLAFTASDFKRLTKGIVPVSNFSDRDGSLLHVFPAYDNLLCRIITKEEYLEIYGV